MDKIFIKVGRTWQETGLDLNSCLYMAGKNYKVKVVHEDGTETIYE